MTWTRVKICGITRPEDALAAEQAGCDAVGFVFYPDSPRYVTVDRARAIVDVLSPLVTKIGIFVSPTVEEVEKTANEVRLDAAQLCGALDCDRWNKADLGICLIRALGVQANEPILWDEIKGIEDYLLDAPDDKRHGGTGQTFNWNLLRDQTAGRRIWLAGGLNLQNITGAIETVRPFAVDVSTGVEERPGIKSKAKIEAFIAMVHAASILNTRND